MTLLNVINIIIWRDDLLKETVLGLLRHYLPQNFEFGPLMSSLDNVVICFSERKVINTGLNPDDVIRIFDLLYQYFLINR